MLTLNNNHMFLLLSAGIVIISYEFPKLLLLSFVTVIKIFDYCHSDLLSLEVRKQRTTFLSLIMMNHKNMTHMLTRIADGITVTGGSFVKPMLMI